MPATNPWSQSRVASGRLRSIAGTARVGSSSRSPVIEGDRDRAENFREAALRHAAQQLHLREPQMRVHDSECHRQIAVALSLDKRDEPVAPADLDRRAKRQFEPRQGREALRDRLRARPMAQPGPGQPPGEAGDPGDRC